MSRYFSIVVIILFLAGCVNTNTVKLDQSVSRNMSGKSMIVTTSDQPDFAAMTAGKAMFGLVGALAMIHAGNKVIQQFEVEDPAVYIGQNVAKEVTNSLYVDTVHRLVPSKKDDLISLMSAHEDQDYILDVRTINWSFGYFPTDWSHYRVMYSVKSRLIDVRKKQVIAEAFCSRIPKESDGAPSHEELLNNNAARLKEELKVAADYCASELKQKML